MNLNDISKTQDQQIVVQGIGVYGLEQAKKNIQGKLHDLTKRVDALMQNPEADQDGWIQLNHLLKKGTLQAFVEAVAKASQQE